MKAAFSGVQIPPMQIVTVAMRRCNDWGIFAQPCWSGGFLRVMNPGRWRCCWRCCYCSYLVIVLVFVLVLVVVVVVFAVVVVVVVVVAVVVVVVVLRVSFILGFFSGWNLMDTLIFRENDKTSPSWPTPTTSNHKNIQQPISIKRKQPQPITN